MSAEERVMRSLKGRDEIALRELVDEVSSISKIPRHVAARTLYKLSREGRIEIFDPDPPGGFSRYLSSWYSWWFWSLVVLVAAALILALAVPPEPPLLYLRYAIGSLFVLYLPGSALIEALYPEREGLSQLERLALSIGLSLALVPLVGLVLNYTPWGIRLAPVTASLALLTILLGLVGSYRKSRILALERVGS